MEELAKSWSCLTLSDVEVSQVSITEEEAIPEFVLAAKFLTKRALNVEAIAKTFTPIWRMKNGFRVTKESDHVVLFTFDNKTDLEQVLNTEPWSFDKHLMVLHRYDKEVEVSEIDFNTVTFWIQVHELPVRFRTRAVAEKICGAAGVVDRNTEECDSMGDGFVRVRVKVDISKPLCRGRVVSLENGKEIWVSFKYERLSNLCYWCGNLTHDDRDCEVWIESGGTLPSDAQQYGAWIRALPFVRSKRSSVSVPGFYKQTATSSSTPTTAKQHEKPRVMIRRGGPVPEIIRSGKEKETPNQEGNKSPDFQETNPVESMPFHTDSHVDIEVNAGNTDQIKGSLSAELFEEKLEEINRELSKFDTATEFQSKSNSPTGEENILESMTINEIYTKATQAHATLSCSNRAPLSALADTSQLNTGNIATWKRQLRYTTGTDVIMEDAVGSKRSAHPTGGQPELQKKKKIVSRVGKGDKERLAEAGSQPRQNQ